MRTLQSTYKSFICHSHHYWYMHACLVTSVISDSLQPYGLAHQVPLSMGFSRQKYWSGLPCPPPGDLPNPWIKPTSLISPALHANSLPTEPPWKPLLALPLLMLHSAEVYCFDLKHFKHCSLANLGYSIFELGDKKLQREANTVRNFRNN